ncbi:TIR domain-containing protein [Rhizobium sp. LEGMi198b]
MAKPTVFIGSSVETKYIAELVQNVLDFDVTPIIWTQDTFEPTQYPLDALESRLKASDFAIFICVPEENDHTVIRGQKRNVIRDNIIFELGLAMGRLGRDRTFLISPRNADLHLPSDLLGISPENYDQVLLSTSPEAALGPACNRIKRKMASIRPLERPEPTEARSDKADEDEPRAVTNELAITVDWTAADFRWQYAFAIFSKNQQRADEIAEAFLKSRFASSDEEVAHWEASEEYTTLFSGRAVDVELIRSRSERYPQNAALMELLGRTMQHYGEVEEARRLLLDALDATSDIAQACAVIERIIQLSDDEDEQPRAEALLQKLNAVPRSTNADEADFLTALGAIARYAGFKEIPIAIGEMIVTRRPSDATARFELAFDYSEQNQPELAALHYDAIPKAERTGVAWNNLGVAFAKLQLKGMAVAAYQEASAKGETIADGNLAQMLQEAGFLAEAQQKAEGAISIENHDPFVVTVLTSLQAARSKEAADHTAALKIGASRQKVRRVVGRAAAVMSGPDILGEWSTPDGIIKLVSDEAGGYTSVTEFERPVENGVLWPLLATKERVQVTVRLRRFGAALEGSIFRVTLGKPTTLLGMVGTEKTLLLSIAEDGDTIAGFEWAYGETAVTWARVRVAKQIET